MKVRITVSTSGKAQNVGRSNSIVLADAQSIEEIDKRADFILPTHEEGVLEHPVYPYPGMPVRERRKVVAGASFFLGGM